MIDTAKFFKEKKYVLIKEMIPKDIAKVAAQYSHYDRASNFRPENENAQIPGSHSVYGDPLMETLLNFGRKKIEQSTGLELWPTYSYYRLYKIGDVLKRHKDRPSCEISATLQISTNREDNWPIWFQLPDNSEKLVNMKNGDMAIYKGCEREHWREPLQSKYGRVGKFFNQVKKRKDDTYHHQIFLHYVNAQGPYVHYAYDRQ